MTIPAKYRERVAEVKDDREEENGWWIHLKDGWVCDCSAAPHTIHEDTVAECLRCLRKTRKDGSDLPCVRCNGDDCETCEVCIENPDGDLQA